MVDLVDVQEWAQPFSALELPVPSARRYRTHSQATLCGGHICLVLTPNGEVKIFGEGFNYSISSTGAGILQTRSRTMKHRKPPLDGEQAPRIGSITCYKKHALPNLSSAVLESIAQIDGSVVLDLDSRLLACGAILRHRQQVAADEEIGEGGHTAAAIGASQFGNVLMVSEGGRSAP